jgi:uncharacterized protein YdhG (YjbR/CyaY superfamily)
MDKDSIKFKTVDEYLAEVPPKVRRYVEEIRKIIREEVPGSEEVISYNMPAVKFHGILLYFAVHKAHIGFYPGNASLIDDLKDELAGYETSKGTIKFPFDKPLSLSLIRKIVKIRARENLEKA